MAARVRSGVALVAVAACASLLCAQAPAFDVDRLWPKPLPNHWILGSVTGISVDAQDHIWLVHRGLDSLTARTEAGTGTTPPTAEDCCAPAPPVLEFDAAGTLVGHWGGPGQGYDWPTSPGAIRVDAKGNVWITAAGAPESLTPPRGGGAGGGRAGGGAGAAAPRPEDAHVLKFSRTGQFLLQIGKAGQIGEANSQTSLDHPADVAIDTTANEVYIADGGKSQRVVVFDATTGAFKRQWAMPQAAASRVSSILVRRDGRVYVGDRKNNAVAVFKNDGTPISSGSVAKDTKSFGSVWGLGLSTDPQQRYLFVADGQNEKIWILDSTSLATVGSFGDGGRVPGEFRGVTAVAMDSKGVLYTGENYEGKRLQRFFKK